MACLQAGEWAPESEHEAGDGPRRSRINRRSLVSGERYCCASIDICEQVKFQECTNFNETKARNCHESHCTCCWQKCVTAIYKICRHSEKARRLLISLMMNDKHFGCLLPSFQFIPAAIIQSRCCFISLQCHCSWGQSECVLIFQTRQLRGFSRILGFATGIHFFFFFWFTP